jgi:outer membrane protein assembly factor BamB
MRIISIGAIMSSPVVDGGVVFFGSMGGNLYALR